MNHPSPAWRPICAKVPDWFVDPIAHYTDRRKRFLVYEHRTAVLDHSPTALDVITYNTSLLDAVTQFEGFFGHANERWKPLCRL